MHTVAIVTVWGRDGMIMSGDSLGTVTFWDAHVHAAAELPCARRRCAVPCNRAHMYSTAVHTHPPLMFPQEGRSVYMSGVD